jgi:HEAT repeat protein
LLDPEPGVRRAAARAAREARDPADGTALADAARRDPEPIVRTEAVRALAALPATPDSRVADALRDLWTAGDDGLREDIALAWSSPQLWNAGGRDALRVIVASEQGPGVVEAAAAVLRRGDAQGELAESAMAQLVRAMQRGPTPTRLQALAQSPANAKEFVPVVQELAESDDLEIRLAALARLASAKDARAVEKLEALARPGSPVAQRARLGLASAGDRRVQAWVEGDLAAPEAAERLAAATALASMGVAARAAPLLADPDARVRMRAACTMLLAARRDR